MYVCTYVCVSVCMYVYLYVCMCIFMYVYMYVCMDGCIMYLNVHMRMCRFEQNLRLDILQTENC